MSGDSSPAGSTAARAESLRPNALPFVPTEAQAGGMRPIRTKKDVYAAFDAVPFTPSQGVCTPSPTNVAALWMRHPFHPGSFAPYEYVHAWNAMTANYGSPGPASGTSSSGMESPGGYAASGGAPGTPPFLAPPYYSSVFYFPMPISPTAVQMAAQHGGDPSSPAHRGGSPGGGGPFVQGFPGSPGSPMHQGMGSMIFAQGPFAGHEQQQQQQQGTPGAGGRPRRKQSKQLQAAAAAPDSPPDLNHGSSASSSDGITSDGSSGIEITAAAVQMAAGICAAHSLQGDPPHQLVELTSLLQLYGIVGTRGAATEGSGGDVSPGAPDAKVKRQKSQARVNPDGSVRLNARQRRTLRRAQERAMKALTDAQQAQRGIAAEEAAASVAAMHPSFFGSPPSSSPMKVAMGGGGGMAPPAAMAYGMGMGPIPMMAYPGSPGAYGFYPTDFSGPAMQPMPHPAPLMPMGQQQRAAAPWKGGGGSGGGGGSFAPPTQGSGGRQRAGAPRTSRFKTQNDMAVAVA